LETGDLVAAVKLAKHAIASVKSSGGAVEDYLHTVTRLDASLASLQAVSQGDGVAGNSASGNAIRSLTASIATDVEELLTRVRRHQEHLSAATTSPTFKNIIAKVKWGAHESKQVAERRRALSDDLATVGLLFDLDTR
jgi:hypothetical protein